MTSSSTVTRPSATADDQWEMLAKADPVAASQLTPWREATASPGMARPPGTEAIASDWVAAHCTGTNGIVVMPGSSLDLRVLSEHLPNGYRLLVLERDPERLARNLPGLPFGTQAAAGRLVFAIGSDPARIPDQFMTMWRLQDAPEFLLYPVDTDPDSAAFYHAALSMAIRDARLRMMNAGTMIHFGTMWQFNTLRNLPLLAAQPGIDALAGAFAGRPAIVIGAGPSLNDALPMLKAAAPGAVTLAVATALRPLRQAGIRPDLVVAVDGHPKTANQYNAPCEDLFLACSTLVFPPAVGRFRGAFSGTLASNPIDAWLDTMLPPRGQMVAAGTVTTSAMDLAVHMGCTPILTVGFDLCFRDDGTTHAQNTMYHGVRVETTHEQVVWVPGNHQETVATSRQFSHYIDLAAQYIAQRPGTRFINVNTGGARIPGMIPATLDELAHLIGPPGDAFARITELHGAHQPPSTEPMLNALRDQEQPLSRLMADARRAASLCNGLMRQLQSRDPDRAAIEALLTELEQTDSLLTAEGLSSQLVEMSLWAASFALNARPDATGLAPHSAGVAANKQWRQFYEQIAGATMWTRDLLHSVVLDLERTSKCPAGAGMQTQHQGRSL